MFDLTLKEYELNIEKANAMFESAKNIFNIQLLELMNLKNGDFIEESYEVNTNIFKESSKNFLDKVKEFFKSLKEAFIKLVDDAKYKIETEIRKRQVNKKLKDIKEALSSNREYQKKVNQKKVKFFDSASYMNSYRKYINIWVVEVRKLYAKSYSSADEYKKALTDFDKKMEETAKKLKIDEDESFYISISASDALKMSEKELDNYNKDVELLEKEYEKALETAENISTNTDDPSKISDIKARSNKMSKKSSDAGVKKLKKTMASLAVIFSIGGLLSYTRSTKKGYNDGYIQGYDDNYTSMMKNM